jgi:hypothetical protein
MCGDTPINARRASVVRTRAVVTPAPRAAQARRSLRGCATRPWWRGLPLAPAGPPVSVPDNLSLCSRVQRLGWDGNGISSPGHVVSRRQAQARAQGTAAESRDSLCRGDFAPFLLWTWTGYSARAGGLGRAGSGRFGDGERRPICHLLGLEHSLHLERSRSQIGAPVRCLALSVCRERVASRTAPTKRERGS